MRRPNLGGITAAAALVMALGAGVAGGAIAGSASNPQAAPAAPVQVRPVAEEATSAPETSAAPVSVAAPIVVPAPVVEEAPVTSPETIATGAAAKAKAEADRAKAEADRAAAERAKAEAAAGRVTTTPAPSPSPSASPAKQVCQTNDQQFDPIVLHLDGSYTFGEERVCAGTHWFVNTPAQTYPAFRAPKDAKAAATVVPRLVRMESTKDASVRVWFRGDYANDVVKSGDWRVVAPEPEAFAS